MLYYDSCSEMTKYSIILCLILSQVPGYTVCTFVVVIILRKFPIDCHVVVFTHDLSCLSISCYPSASAYWAFEHDWYGYIRVLPLAISFGNTINLFWGHVDHLRVEHRRPTSNFWVLRIDCLLEFNLYLCVIMST